MKQETINALCSWFRADSIETLDTFCEFRLRRFRKLYTEDKDHMFRWLLNQDACLTGLFWALAYANTLEQLWDQLVLHNHVDWRIWLDDKSDNFNPEINPWSGNDRRTDVTLVREE